MTLVPQIHEDDSKDLGTIDPGFKVVSRNPLIWKVPPFMRSDLTDIFPNPKHSKAGASPEPLREELRDRLLEQVPDDAVEEE